LSEESFSKIWDNEEDSIYDTIWKWWCYPCSISV
jgi:hypothetical protein